MGWHTEPVTSERFDDFADVINPRRRKTHCWCLSPRLGLKEIDELGGGDRESAMRALCARDLPPGVVAYRDDVPVGWCHISPRTEIPRLVRSKLIRPVDELDVWCIICLVTRPGHRREGVTHHLIEGAVAWARANGAPGVEAYPVDPSGRMDAVLAYVGTRSMFERAGFEVVGTTLAQSSRMPRIIMRTTFR